jgi:hypothetical protein
MSKERQDSRVSCRENVLLLHAGDMLVTVEYVTALYAGMRGVGGYYEFWKRRNSRAEHTRGEKANLPPLRISLVHIEAFG